MTYTINKKIMITIFVFLMIFFYGCKKEKIIHEVMEKAKETELDESTFKVLPGDVLEIMFQIKQGHISKYTIQSHDEIEIKFPSLPNFNSIQKVRPDGYISLYHIGDISILNLTIKEATEKIKDAFKDILWEPDIYLSVKSFGGNLHELKSVISSFERGQSKLITVRPDGHATFPLISEIDVRGKTLSEIQVYLNEEYRKIYPEVYVDLLFVESGGRNVSVLGEVNRPGTFSIVTSQNILEVLARAGGYTNDAVLSHVILIDSETFDGTRINVEKMLKKQMLDSKILMIHPGDIVFVPKSKITNVAYFVQKLSQSVLFRGIGLNFSRDIRNDGF